MQEPPDPVIVALIFALVITIIVIVILVIRQYTTSRKPYQFTDDITDLNKIFVIKRIPPEVSERAKEIPIPPSVLSTAPLQYPTKPIEEVKKHDE